MTPDTFLELQSFVGMNLAVFALRALGATAILVAGWWAAGRAGRVAGFAVERSPGLDDTLKPLVVSLVKNALRIATVMAALANFGVETSSLLAVFGAAGLAIGLALQGTLSNVAAGVMLLLLRPFRVADLILVQGHTGVVGRIGLFTTELTTADNLYVSLPNGSVWGAAIVNYSRHPMRRIDLTVGIDYGDDVDLAIRIAIEVLLAQPEIAREPAPMAAVRALGESSVDLAVRGFVNQENYLTTVFALQKALKQRFQAEGIRIPFPQRTVHVQQDGVVPGGRGTGGP
jgi:small conductance mechanosensitive channel